MAKLSIQWIYMCDVYMWYVYIRRRGEASTTREYYIGNYYVEQSTWPL